MKHNYYLPGLNGDVDLNNKSFPYVINESKTPKTHLFITDTSAFYRKYCDNLNKYKLREKRLLDFETPNRALITHEYDIKISENNFDFTKFYYLFNPIKRLSWLKILQDGKRLTICEESKVKEYIKCILKDELETFFPNPYEVFEKLWEYKQGFPCFVYLETTTNKSFLLISSYYDSLKTKESTCFLRTILDPFIERKITYNYFPLENKSSWLYIKAPNNFDVKYNKHNTIYNKDINKIDLSYLDSSEADPGKLSLTIINKGNISSKEDTVKICFNIEVPMSLKYWFKFTYYLLLIVCIMLTYEDIYLLLNDSGSILLGDINFVSLVTMTTAAIIATRGWLISEETIMKYYTINISLLMPFMLFMYLLNFIIKSINLL